MLMVAKTKNIVSPNAGTSATDGVDGDFDMKNISKATTLHC